MAAFRRVVFWCHLGCGVTAGVIVLVMSVTGVLLTYQRQMQWWADTRHYRSAPASGTERLGSAALISAADQFEIGTPASISLRADPSAPAAVTVGTTTIYVNPYTGIAYGEGTGAALRAFFAKVVVWHRYMAFEGESRPIGKGIAGAANLMFFFIVLSGMYLWWPRALRWTAIRNITWFRRDLTPKARDFNWHNVFGFWTALPLALVVFGGVVISYPWATNLVYRAVGDTPPPAPAPRAGGPGAPSAGAGRGRGAGAAPAAANLPGARNVAGGVVQTGGAGRDAERPGPGPEAATASGVLVDKAIALVMAGEPDWNILTVRLPTSAEAPASVTVDRGDGGQPQLRSTVTVNAKTMAITQWERFDDQSAGRRARSFLRFAHTGEYAGLVGQTIAGIVSGAGALLVYSGLALSLRRFAAWRVRKSARAIVNQTAT